MSRKANIDKALKVGGSEYGERGPSEYEDKLLEAVSVAYDLSVEEGLRKAERRLSVFAKDERQYATRFTLEFAITELREARKRKGKK